MTTANSFGNPPLRTFPMHPRVELASAAALPTEFGSFRIHVFTSDKDDREQVAIVHSDVFGVESVATRIHSECLYVLTQAPFHASVMAAFRRHLAGISSRAETTGIALQATTQ